MGGIWGGYGNMQPPDVQDVLEAYAKEVAKWRGYRSKLLEAQEQLKRVGKVSLRLVQPFRSTSPTPPTPLARCTPLSIPIIAFAKGHCSIAVGHRIATRCTLPRPPQLAPTNPAPPHLLKSGSSCIRGAIYSTPKCSNARTNRP